MEKNKTTATARKWATSAKVAIAAFAIAASATFGSCSKEKDEPCASCQVVIANGEPYDYKVSFEGMSYAPFTMKPGTTKTISVKAGILFTVVGDYQSPYSHNNFKKSFRCPGDCGVLSVVLMQ